MDFKQIEAFSNVARFKSFSKAAEAIYLSQPTVSAHISALEDELRVQLFDRSGKDVQLTPAGQLFYDYAINLLNIRNQAVQSIAQFYNKIEGELHIASSTTPCRSILPEALKIFSHDFPCVTYRITELSSNDVISSILKFNAEIGIAGKSTPDPRLSCRELTNDNLVLLTPASGKFLKMKEESISFKEVSGECFVLRERDSATRQFFESSIASKGFSLDRLKIFSEVSTMDAVLQFVRQGLGVTVISENAAKDFINLGLVKRFYISDLELNRKIYILKYNKRTLSPPAKIFENFMISLYDKK